MLARSLCKILLVFLFPAFAVAGQEARAPRVVDLTAPDGLKLKGTFSAAAASGPGVLLLHQCNRQRKVWDDLARRMTAAGMNVMTVDLRGYGDSEGTPIDKLTPEEVDMVFNEKIPLDVETAYQFLVVQPAVSPGILVAGGASCGVNQSVHLAMKHPEIKALVLLSEITDMEGRSFLRAHPSLPLFLATAEDDADPGVSDLMQWLSTFSTNPHTKFVRYKTGGHGVEMFVAHPELPMSIVDWVTIAVRSPNVAPAKGSPNASPVTQFLDALDQPGAAANAPQLYAEAFGKHPKGAAVSEVVLNRVGYDHLQNGDKKGAIAILKLNASLYPNSPNVYDSLGDAYLADGQKDLARQNAHKALDLLAHDTTDPEDRRKAIRDSAEQKLKQLSQPR
ncbi:MAG: alpha/beta hydrolase [Acidobacteria bacterium Pan2503]|uniref:Alpha/beta hydrolase n=1 Tax=Candidatus Acidiferrum panamense TaxID=2741543 RepID=A0A7V8T0Q4_9BACT|nr:alpha/beta hydrolase [Candidatus Acidoferrum panamensis]